MCESKRRTFFVTNVLSQSLGGVAIRRKANECESSAEFRSLLLDRLTNDTVRKGPGNKAVEDRVEGGDGVCGKR